LAQDSTSPFGELLKIDELKMTRQFMVERFFPKIALTPFSSQSWAFYIRETRQQLLYSGSREY
jgi:hypothetical protein